MQNFLKQKRIRGNVKRKFFGNLYYRSFNFYKKYKLDKENPNLLLKKINLKYYYKSLVKPLKFGIMNIVLKKNNIFVNLSNKFNKLIYLRSGGLLEFKGAKKTTNFCREKVIKNVAEKSVNLNYKIIDLYCKFYNRKLYFHIFKALRESHINLRFFIYTQSLSHGFIRYKKLRRI